MKCKDLNIEPCRHCKYTGHVCLVEGTDNKFAKYPNDRKELLIASFEGVFYGNPPTPREDPKEVLRCMGALIRAKYKDLEHLLLLA